MANQQILDYVKQQLQQGLRREDITNSLIASGWVLQDINEGFEIVLGGSAPVPQPQVVPVVNQGGSEARRYTTLFNFAELKKFCIYTFIGGIIASAALAVITVLSGVSFDNEIVGKVFLTFVVVMIHSLVSLAFIWDDSKRHTFDTLPFFINTVFCLVVVSFFAVIFNVWGIISGETLLKTYSTFFVIAFAALHAGVLSKASHKETYLDNLIYVNYGFIIFVVAMLLPVIYLPNPDVLGNLYFRFLAAASIIDGTLGVLVVIFYKLYMQKHPELVEHEQKRTRGLSMWIWPLIIYFAFQIVSSIFFFAPF
ncbi:MAG: hypothetical protein AAB611_01025 [Patescibacteria group bacterium]